MALNIKKLLVSQPKPASEKSPYFDIAEKYGVEIDFRPFIKVEPLSSKEFRQDVYKRQVDLSIGLLLRQFFFCDNFQIREIEDSSKVCILC